MKRIICLLLSVFCFSALAANFTEFYVQTTGDNLNSGHTPDNAATFTATAGFWTNTTRWFYKAGLNPATGGVTNGAWASVFPDGNTCTGFIGYVTNASDATDTIEIHPTASAGTAPALDEVGATSIYVGGAWKGPGQYDFGDGRLWTNTFPFPLVAFTLTNASGNIPWFNFTNNIWNVTNALTIANAGPMGFGGYSLVPRDGLAKATISGGLVVAGFNLLTGSANNTFQDFIFDGCGGSGNASGLLTGAETFCQRCVFRNMRNGGFRANAAANVVVSCEAYSNNIAGIASIGGFVGNGTAIYLDCISYSNNVADLDGNGFVTANGDCFFNCIAWGNGGSGFWDDGVSYNCFVGCDSYKNTVSGIRMSGVSAEIKTIINCNFFANGIGITNATTTPIRNGAVLNCAFGTGAAQTNTYGDFSANFTNGVQCGLDIRGTIKYGADLTPWIDPDNGNFSLASGVVGRAAGYGTFLQSLFNSPTNTVGYFDIGAAPAASTNSMGGTSHTFAQ